MRTALSGLGRKVRSDRRDHTGTIHTFGKQLIAALPFVNVTRPGTGEARARRYEGIQVKPGHHG